MLRNTFLLKITALPTTELPSLSTTLLCPGQPYSPLGTTRKGRFIDLPLWISNAMFLNNLIHQFIFSVLQHLVCPLTSYCVFQQSQDVKHLAVAKQQAFPWKKNTRGSTWPRPHRTAAHCSERSWFRRPVSQHQTSLFCLYSPSFSGGRLTLRLGCVGWSFFVLFGLGGCCIFCFIFKWKPVFWNTILWSKIQIPDLLLCWNTVWDEKPKSNAPEVVMGVYGKKRHQCVCLRILLNAAEWRWTAFSHFCKITASVKKTSPTPLHFGK